MTFTASQRCAPTAPLYDLVSPKSAQRADDTSSLLLGSEHQHLRESTRAREVAASLACSQ